MAQEENKEKKIIIDEDWKAQAQSEKEVLAEQEKAEKESQDQEQPGTKLPPADFAGLVSMLATQAFFALGVIRTKEDEQREPDFILAKYNIDMLGVLQALTKGNLTEDEKQLLDNYLEQAQMAFVKLSEKGS